MTDARSRFTYLIAFLAAVTALTALVGAAAPTAAAASESCADKVVADWYGDGRVDKIYPLHCYTDAIRSLPVDVLDYSNAKEDILRALAFARKGKPDPAPPEARGRPVATIRPTRPRRRPAIQRPERPGNPDDDSLRARRHLGAVVGADPAARSRRVGIASARRGRRRLSEPSRASPPRRRGPPGPRKTPSTSLADTRFGYLYSDGHPSSPRRRAHVYRRRADTSHGCRPCRGGRSRCVRAAGDHATGTRAGASTTSTRCAATARRSGRFRATSCSTRTPTRTSAGLWPSRAGAAPTPVTAPQPRARRPRPRRRRRPSPSARRARPPPRRRRRRGSAPPDGRRTGDGGGERERAVSGDRARRARRRSARDRRRSVARRSPSLTLIRPGPIQWSSREQ